MNNCPRVPILGTSFKDGLFVVAIGNACMTTYLSVAVGSGAANPKLL